LSRNRTFGENLGKGLSVEETVEVTKQTCEGVKSCLPILELGRAHGVDMPITEQVVQVVHHGMSPADMLGALMGRQTKPEMGAE
jgi:glycerol-3-phosphate dehydrogenase (NAD(P)+)